jgi:hypothetical protein
VAVVAGYCGCTVYLALCRGGRNEETDDLSMAIFCCHGKRGMLLLVLDRGMRGIGAQGQKRSSERDIALRCCCLKDFGEDFKKVPTCTLIRIFLKRVSDRNNARPTAFHVPLLLLFFAL